MREFDKKLIHYGRFRVNNEEIGSARCEVTLNEIDTSDLKIIFSSVEGNAPQIMGYASKEGCIDFSVNGDSSQVNIVVDFVGLHLSSSIDEVLRGKIKEYKEVERQKDGTVKKISALYKFMPNKLLRTEHRSIIKHWQKGLLYGWNGYKREFPDAWTEGEQEWITNEFIVPSKLGVAQIHHNFQFYTEEKDGRELYLVVDVPLIEYTIEASNQSLEEIIHRIDAEVEVVSLALSFIQGDFVDWGYSTASCSDSNKKNAIQYRSFRQSEKNKA